jgi:hypothetical protein
MPKRGPVKEKQRFDPWLVIIEFVVEKGKMNHALLGIMRFSPFIGIPPTPLTDHRY